MILSFMSYSTLSLFLFFFFNDPPPTEIYTTTDTLSLHDALPISTAPSSMAVEPRFRGRAGAAPGRAPRRSEEHTSELQSPVVISYAVFCLKKKKANKARKSYTMNHMNHATN